jgi:uncharacterized protein (UPF0212 family)
MSDPTAAVRLCRFCKTELNAGATVCHACGRRNDKLYLWLAIVAVAVTIMLFQWWSAAEATRAALKAQADVQRDSEQTRTLFPNR